MSACSMMIQNRHEIYSMCRHLQCTAALLPLPLFWVVLNLRCKCQMRLHQFAIVVSRGHRVKQNW